MAKDEDSDEDDIWNYKCVPKVQVSDSKQWKKEAERKSSSTPHLRVTRSKSCQNEKGSKHSIKAASVQPSSHQSKEANADVRQENPSLKNGSRTKKSKIKRMDNGDSEPEIIDVELEFSNISTTSDKPGKHNSLVTSSASENLKSTLNSSKSVSPGSSQRRVEKRRQGKAVSGSSELSNSKGCGKNKAASAEQRSETYSKSTRKKTIVNRDMKPIKSPRKSMSKSPSSSQGSAKSQGKVGSDKSECHDIAKFFSPTGQKTSGKRRSSEAVDHLFDSSDDDELMIISEEKALVPPKVNGSHQKDNDSNNSQSNEGPTAGFSTSSQSSISQASEHASGVLGKTELINVKDVCVEEEICQNVVNVDVITEENENDRARFSHEVNADKVTKLSDGTINLDTVDNGAAEGGFIRDSDLCDLFEDNDDLEKCKTGDITYSGAHDTNSETKVIILSPEQATNCLMMNAESAQASLDHPTSSESSLFNDIDLEIEEENEISTIATFEQPVPVAARKQTSLFSYFKAKFNPKGSESQGSSSSLSAKVTSRPGLHCESTTPASSFSSMFSSSSWSRQSWSGKKPALLKAASDSTVQQTYEHLENEEQTQTKGNMKVCPFYKKMPGTAITVDAFRYGVIPGCEAYVLTHFHYDHYGGLTKRFAQPIYCSQVTGNLVESRIGVHKKWINCLPLWKPCQVAGVTLTLMEANHCPGAVIILFELKDGRKILHTGDFRASPDMEEYPQLKGTVISELYLDTTYCNPSYAFPAQQEVIDFVLSLVSKHMADHPHTLIVCGAYTIGKEKIFAAIAKMLDSKICVMNDKKKVLDCLEDPELQTRLTKDWFKGQVHVLPMNMLNQKSLFEHQARHPRFESVLAFQPTGWTHSDKTLSLANLRPKWSTNGITLYGVPYSEHSSFLELKRFVQFLRPKKILPTVNNGNPASRKKMEDIFKQWMQEKPDKPKLSTSQQTKLNAWVS